MNEEKQKLFEALEFAAHKHRKQRRKGSNGIPYINHPIEVSRMIIDKVPDAGNELLMAALLHDVLEDTDTEPEELVQRFGVKVLGIVEEVSDNMSLPSALRKELQIEKAPTLSYEAKCIKIADKACNIRDILYTRLKWTRRRKIEYVEWAIEVVRQIRETQADLVQTFDETVLEAANILECKFSIS